jgi:hypothetical protein
MHATKIIRSRHLTDERALIIKPMTEPEDGETASKQPDDPNDSDAFRDQLKGQTTEHADPPRLEDEGQSGG